jgi:predicted transcriptional regulator
MAETVDTEEQVRRLEQALEEALAERTRIWEELQRNKADQKELAYLRERTEGMESSLSWRLTTPLRVAMQIVRDPIGMLRPLARKLLRRVERS